MIIFKTAAQFVEDSLVAQGFSTIPDVRAKQYTEHFELIALREATNRLSEKLTYTQHEMVKIGEGWPQRSGVELRKHIDIVLKY